MITIAVTGTAGSGKSTVCRFFKELGAHVINLDTLARQAVRPGSAVLKAIVDNFGESALTAAGSLDRAKVRHIILRDTRARKTLERLIHPEVFRLLEKGLRDIALNDGKAIVAVEVPLLIEVGAQDRFDVVVLVEADPQIQKSRLMARDGVSAEEAEALLGLQIPSDKKRPYADHILENVQSIRDMRAAAREIYGQIGGFCEKP
jgi:dephospho-CoA kinase